MLKFISWNVNGLRACVGKDFENQFKELDADFFCLQETKMQEGQLDLTFEGYNSYWNYAEKKGYSGTAIYTKQVEDFFVMCCEFIQALAKFCFWIHFLILNGYFSLDKTSLSVAHSSDFS
jgi:exonuclease III